ncbi:hypothetical protein [Pseudomonas amygdali]|uniref:hypothetical protein n=1 Tax=Pseudomonas amygdali TaxID=47877 RepID=UPI0002D36031|nr:hypothetical protein [Pseudomonas amygdali]
MSESVSYSHERKYKLSGNIINRLQAAVLELSSKVLNSKHEELSDGSGTCVEFLVECDVSDVSAKVLVAFDIGVEHINSIKITVVESGQDLGEVALKYFSLALVDRIVGGEFNGELKRYTVRTYSRYFCSHPIMEEILIKSDFKFLFKPFVWTSKEEPLTEQILMLDIEVDAVNLEHARSLAYNYASNVNAYLSVLLDVGFEMLFSEFRIIKIKRENGGLELGRWRTAFIDYELGLLVKDNHYGLKELANVEHVNSFQSGKLALNFASERPDGTREYQSTSVIDLFSNNDFLEVLYSQHKINRPGAKGKRAEEVPINRGSHYPDFEIRMPSVTRRYFKSISLLDAKKKDAFLGCCRMYNIAHTAGGQQPTLGQSYKVCAVEALAESEGLSFSEFMIKYSCEGFDKKLSDYFYSVRSGHFHSGKFYFEEFSVNFQREIALEFSARTQDLENFNRFVRAAIVGWIEQELIPLSVEGM